MRMVFALLLVVACDAGDTSRATKTEPETPVPAGPYVVRYHCSHSMEPWGRGGSIRNMTFDLGAKTYELHAYEYSGEATPQPTPPPTPVVTPLAATRVATIEAAVKNVLRGGPYKPEYPVPEGTPCTLSISGAGKELLKLEKAYTNEPDAASQLVKALGGGSP